MHHEKGLIGVLALSVLTACSIVSTISAVLSGLYYRYPVREMCPSPEFLQILIVKGVEFTMSSDVNFPVDLGRYINRNTELLKELGVKKLVEFHSREKV